MRTFNHFHGILTLGTLVLVPILQSGCGLRSSTQSLTKVPTQITPPRESMKIEGTMTEALRRLQSHENRDSCDEKNAPIQTLLVSALEQKAEDLLKNPPPSAPSEPNDSHWIPFQGSHLLDLPQMPAKRSGWLTGSSGSWTEVHEKFLNPKNREAPEFWSEINSEVRSLLLDDQRRIIHGMNFGFDHASVLRVDELLLSLDQCKRDPRCLEPALAASIKADLKRVPLYLKYFETLERTAGSQEKRNLLLAFRNRVEIDHLQHQFRPNPNLTLSEKDSQHRFTLALAPGDLDEDSQATVKKIVESIWKDADHSFTLEWIQTQGATDLFKFFFHGQEGGTRPFVAPDAREIHLFPGNRTRSIAHEFGHVLGIDDHYYTFWDPEACEYRTEVNLEDLMSSSLSGNVTEGEWEQITPKRSPEG